MKKSASHNKRFLLMLIAIGIVFILASCSVPIEYAQPKVASISVYSLSKVDGYVAGDELDLTDAKLLVIFDNGDKKIIDLTKDMIDLKNLNMSEPEQEKTVTVVYGGVKTSFVISVESLVFQKVELTKLPDKTLYIEGEKVNPSGAELSIHYEGGTVVKTKVTSDMLDGYSNTVGRKQIKINYFGAKNLFFEVEFVQKTATGLEIQRPPAQVSVFQNYGDRLSSDDMKIKITYDNAVAEVYENAIVKSGSNTEVVARERAKWKDYIQDNLYFYINDTAVSSTVLAKVAYKEPSATDTIEYTFIGTPKVRTGDIVNTGTVIADTYYLESIKSKSEGIVTAVTSSSVTVSRKVTYRVNNPAYAMGDVVIKEDSLGTQAGSIVKTRVSGLITKVEGGEITVMALPVASFKVSVTDRSFQSMEIIQEPVTKVHRSSIYNIIQGDTLDLDTGRVRVTFDNGETETYSMGDAAFIKVINSATNLRNEIPGFSFTGVGNVSNVPAGANYDLLYGFAFEDGYTYPPEALSTVVSVLDEFGNVNVINNRTIVPQTAKNYTVSIVVTYTDLKGQKYISEASYILSTVGAQSKAEQLDITAAGRHTLKVIYGGISEHNTEMEINVVQKVPVRIIIDSETDNIGQHSFHLGDALPFSTISYRLEYSNGDIDERATAVTRNMVINRSEFVSEDLVCTEVGSDQYIDVSIPNSSVQSQRLYFNVIPLPIVNLTVDENPTDQFLTGKGITNGGIAGVTSIDLSGAVILVSYLKGSSTMLKDTSGDGYMMRLFNNGKTDSLPNIKIAFDEADEDPLTEEDIYGPAKRYYLAVLTYTDEYHQSYTTTMKYYIVARKPRSIKVSVAPETVEWRYKSDYIQCEDWDFTGMSVIATYEDEGGTIVTETVDLKPYMVYKTDTNTIGNGFPLIVRYLGMLEESPSVSFNVRERVETGIRLKRPGVINYVTTGAGLDLGEYQFEITFNAGTSRQVNGIFAFTGGLNACGWWYEVFDAEIPAGSTDPEPVLDAAGKLIKTSMRVVGYKMIRLYHTSEYEARDPQGRPRYNVIFTDFFVRVENSNVPIASIRFDDTDTYCGGIPVLGKVAAGMPLIYTYYDQVNNLLKEKLLTIVYTDNTVGHLNLSHADLSIDYRTEETTTGLREVNIRYDVFNCKIYVEVIDASLVAIDLVTVPPTNFINGETFSIEGGILRATFRENGSDLTFSTYVLMSAETPMLKYDDVDCNIPVYTDESHTLYNEYQHKTISISYGKETNKVSTSYVITIYNPLDVHFTYSDVIFFYGNSSDATVTAHQQIEGFVLPTEDDPRTPENEANPTAIRKFYVSSEFFKYLTPEQYEAERVANANLVPIVLWDKDNDRELIVYYDLDDVCKYNGEPSRPYVPVTRGYSYYILMMVEGNRYYRTRNYAYQTYTIIPKVIEVNVVTANENAFVLRVFTDDNPTAVKGLYSDINTINGAWTSTYSFIQKIELASPNKDYFEILMTVTSEYNDTMYNYVVTVFNAIRGQIQNYQKGVKKVVIDDSRTRIIKGVNVAEYNGGQPDYITYTVAAGETLTYYNVLDLLEGKLEILVPGGIYGIGDYKIHNDNGTLHHNNYNIQLVTTYDTVFRVKKCVVENMVVMGSTGEIGEGGLLEITVGDPINVYVITASGASRRINDYELEYFTSPLFEPASLVTELAATEDVYYARIKEGYYLEQNAEGYRDFGFTFRVKVNADV